MPQVLALTQGRWYLPDGDFDRALSVVDDGDDFRALWIGDPDVLPLSGWSLESVPGVNIGMSEGLDPVDVAALAPRRRRSVGRGRRECTHSRPGGAHRTSGARCLADGDPLRGGGRPARPRALRAPPRYAMPVGVVDALEEQLDLRRILVAPGIDLFEVTARLAPTIGHHRAARTRDGTTGGARRRIRYRFTGTWTTTPPSPSRSRLIRVGALDVAGEEATRDEPLHLGSEVHRRRRRRGAACAGHRR